MPGNILVVDDEYNLRQTLAFILKRAGYQVTTTESAQEALNTLKTSAFDLMILDLKMPEMDGLALLEIIRADHPHLPVFILTAYGNLDTAIDALRLEARDYLLKPIDPALLLERIDNILKAEQNNHRRDEILSQMHALMVELGEIDPMSTGEQAQSAQDGDHDPSSMRKGAFYADLKARYLEVNNRPVALSPSAFAYLVTLLRHAPKPVTYRDLVQESQGKEVSESTARSLTRWQVYQIRKGIEKDVENPVRLINVRNFGYRLITDFDPH